MLITHHGWYEDEDEDEDDDYLTPPTSYKVRMEEHRVHFTPINGYEVG